MSRHSKNNTSRAFFTYAEKQMVEYGTKKQRLGGDSKRSFDSCYLCLQTARDPLICLKGHLSCKECVYESILEQKAEISRQLKEYNLKEKQLTKRKGTGSSSKETAVVLRKDTSEILRDKRGKPYDKPGSVVVNDKAKNDKKLASFWIPSLTSEAEELIKKPKKVNVECLADVPHPLKLKQLVPVKFTLAGDNTEKICSICSKDYINSSKICILSECGHAFCENCTFKFIEMDKKCTICDTKVNIEKSIKLKIDGTGFVSGGGRAEATRYDIGFVG